MIQRISLLAVCGLMLGLTAPSGWAETGDPAKGKAVYERLCVACHGAQGKGDGPAGQMMRPPAADLTGSKVKTSLMLNCFRPFKTEDRRPQCQPSRDNFLISKSTTS